MKLLAATLCSVLIVCAAPSQGPGSRARAIEDILPASTFGCLKFGGLEACVAAADRLPAADILREFVARLPEATREQHLDDQLEEAAAQVRRVLQRQGLAPRDVRAVLSCPMVVGVGRPTIEGMGPSVAVVVDGSDRADAIRRVIAALEALGERQGVIAAVERGQVAGVEVRSWLFRDGPTIHYGAVEGHLVVTNSPGYLREIVAVAAGNAPCLAADSTLGAVRELLAGTTLFSMFANTAPFCAVAEPFLPYEMAEWSKALGIGELDGIFCGASAGKHGSSEVLHFGMRGDEGGLFKVAASKPLDFSAAKCFSPNTVAFGAVRLDLPALIGAFDRFLDVLPAGKGDEARRELMRELGREFRHGGTTPKEVHTLLRAFGDQMTAALSLEKAAIPKPELLVRIEVRDAARVGALLQRIEATLAEQEHLTWKQREVAGVSVRFVNVEVDRQLKLSPCYALVEGALLLGSDTQCLIRALGRDPHESLAAQRDFAALQRGADGAFGVLHLRLFRLAEVGWRTVETMGFPQLDAHADELGFDSGAMPSGEDVAVALGTATTAAFVDANGYTLRSHGTLGSGSYLAAMAFLVDDVLRRAAPAGKIY